MTLYKCISSDPPWPEHGGGRVKRGADRHYDLLSIPQIITVMSNAPVWTPDKSGCLMWMWATRNYLESAFVVLKALGFRYITDFIWIKPKLGLGQRSRSRHEHLLLGRMGKVPLPGTKDRPDSVIDQENMEADAYEAEFGGPMRDSPTEHSAKPQEAYRRIERCCAGPRLEMFARDPREGWTVWGDQV